jgi:hypothetical protein
VQLDATVVFLCGPPNIGTPRNRTRSITTNCGTRSSPDAVFPMVCGDLGNWEHLLNPRCWAGCLSCEALSVNVVTTLLPEVHPGCTFFHLLLHHWLHHLLHHWLHLFHHSGGGDHASCFSRSHRQQQCRGHDNGSRGAPNATKLHRFCAFN